MEQFLLPLITEYGPLIIATVVPFAVAGFKKVWPNLPNFLKPIIAGVLGPVIDLGIAALAGIETSGIAAALIGLAGVGVREIGVEIKKAMSEA